MKIRMGKLTDCFLSSYTKDGYKSFFAEEAKKMRQIILLKGASMQIRSKLYKAMAQIKAEEGFDVELLHQAQNANFLEGIILKKDAVLLVDYAEEKEKKKSLVFDLLGYLDAESYGVYEAKIKDLEEQIRVNLELLQENGSLLCHNLGQKTPMDEKEEQKILQEMAEEYFFAERTSPHVRFAQGLDLKGRVNYYQEILKDINTKQYLAGDNWADKSAVLEKLAQEAVKGGYYTTIYYDSWDGERAELLVVAEKKLAVAAERLTADFTACRWSFKDKGGYRGEYSLDIKRLLDGVNRLQNVLEEIYADVLAEEYLGKAKENLTDKLNEYTKPPEEQSL